MASGNFDRALALVLKHEGGFVDHPRDPGGATNLGVTIGTAKRLGIDVDGDGDTDVIDIKLLRVSDAAKVYRSEFWNKIRADELPAGVDYCVFDFAVNSGPKRAAMALQRAIGVADDGVVGKFTLANLANKPVDQIIERVCADRMTFLRRLSTFPVFGKGWTSRVNGVLREATNMATMAPVPTAPVETGPLFPPAPRRSGTPEAALPPLPPVVVADRPSLGSRLFSWFSRPWFG